MPIERGRALHVRFDPGPAPAAPGQVIIMTQALRTLIRPLLLLLLLLPAAAGRAFAAPAQQSGNLLQNPSMDQPFNNGVADKWTLWVRETPKSVDDCTVAYHYRPRNYGESGNPTYIRDGNSSQAIANNWDTWSAGLYQNVPATPGTTYRFTFYAKGRGSNENQGPSETGLNMNIRAGIDPNGSGNWADGDVVWGASGSPHDQWLPFSVEATATGNQITVFTSADWGVTGVVQCRKFMDTWYDSAELVALTPPTATPAPLPTAAPPTAVVPTATPASIATEPAAATVAAVQTATAAPTVEQTPTATAGGTICVNAFLDENANGLHDPNEGYVTDVALTVAQGSRIIGQQVSTGTDKPVCFANLPPGEYQVAQTVPAALESTTQSNATVQVADGQTVGLEFGSRLRTAQPTATAATDIASVPTPTIAGATDPGTTADSAPTWLVLIGLASVMVGIALLGGLLYLLLRRQG